MWKDGIARVGGKVPVWLARYTYRGGWQCGTIGPCMGGWEGGNGDGW